MGVMKMIQPIIDLDQLSELVKTNPQYTKLFIGLAQIDKFIKQVVRDTIESHTSNPDAYYIRTELNRGSYIVSMECRKKRKSI